MKILITGAGGMLGTDLCAQLAGKHEVVGAGRNPAPHLRVPFQTADVSQPDSVRKLFHAVRPEMVLHVAAMTNVDQCELERKDALRYNFEMTRLVADACNQTKALLIFFSTDYVFDGTKQGPYKETDVPHPLNIYGESKFLGERYLLIRGKRFLIFRAAWTYGKQGNSFPKKVLKQAEAGKPIPVLTDQIGSPTFTGDLAHAVSEVIDALPHAEKKSENQIYHLANEGQASRYEFAQAVLKKKNYPADLVVPASDDQINRPAKRPQNSVFSTEKIKEHFGIKLRSWEAALDAYLQEETAGTHAKY